MKTITTFILLIGIALLSFQCRKELNPSAGLGNPSNTPSAPITATLQGNVVDENNQPSPGVSITVGTTAAITDAHGYFKIANTPLDKKAALVTAIKTGYFKAYRTFCATSGINQVYIKLIPRTLAGTVNANAGGTVSLTNGSKVLLPANGVVIASNGAAYSGSINVYAAYIDPTDADISKTIPGSFMGNDTSGKRVTLTSYGMLAVELESSSGTRLQIAAGNTATLTTPIPSSLQASAPASISLWYVNDTTGLWQEQGSATKTGTNYIGIVPHFSYWNCDYASPLVQFSVIFKTEGGLPLANALVGVKLTSDSGCRYGYTDNLGQTSGGVPANSSLTVEVFDQCNDIIYSKNIGTLSSTIDLGTITIPTALPNVVTITGKLVNCSNAPVTNGFAEIVYQDIWQQVQCNSAGDFSATIIECSNGSSTCQIYGVDNNAHQQGSTTNIPIRGTAINAGNIIACGTYTPYYITLKGKLVDCNNVPVSNGYANIYSGYNGYTIPVACDANGNFSTTLYYSPNPDSSSNQSCQITGIDATAGQQGSVTNVSIASLLVGTVADAGDIVACGTPIVSNISYTLDGTVYRLINISSGNLFTAIDSTGTPRFISSPYVSISGYSQYTGYANSDIQFYFKDAPATTGAYPITYLFLNFFGDTLSLIQPFNVTVTNYAQNVGGYYQGSFSGQFVDLSDPLHTVHTISCTFNQPRTQ